MSRCPLCGEDRRHREDCPNPEDGPQAPISWEYWKYLNQTEDPDDGDPTWHLFVRWALYRLGLRRESR